METYILDEKDTLDLWKAKIDELEKENKKLKEELEEYKKPKEVIYFREFPDGM